MAETISKKAIDMIIAFEVTSKSYYEKKYQKPEWPEGASGITIGIGYDLGYASEEKIRGDWTGKIEDDMVDSLVKFKGYKGEAAKDQLAAARKEINIPWDAAYAVFIERDVPEWTNRVKEILPNYDYLSEDSLGAIVSLAFNRGASFNAQGPRYAEMRAIKEHMLAKQFTKIPQDIRDMKRLWPGVRGLLDRRDQEANLFKSGL